MKSIALDSSALVSWVLQENGRWRAVDRILNDENVQPVFPAPGLTELITIAHRRGNTSSAAAIISALSAKRVRFEMLQESDLVRAAELSELSVQHPGPISPWSNAPTTVSLGDSLILAVAERLAVPIVTRDGYWKTFAAAGHTSAMVTLLN